MPWAEVSTMSLRYEFAVLSVQPGANMAQLCRRFGISRKSGYKWRERFMREGRAGLKERSRRPHHSPARSEACVEAAVVQLRLQRGWGARKIQSRLKQLGHIQPPAPATISGILSRHGLIDPRASEQRQSPQRFERQRPNELWQMDFKGHFPMLQGRCHPLTVLDDHSRYAIVLKACKNERGATVQTQLIEAFRRYGLPEQMLMDNGAPWCTPAARSLTTLSVWLVRLGIRLCHGRPYHPQTQGKDERFHRSLDVEVIQRYPIRDLSHCQRRFDCWRDIYNLERPHEGIQMQVPAQRYQCSSRVFPEHLPSIEYAPHDHVRKIQAQGELFFAGKLFRVSKALRGHPVALRPTSVDGRWDVFFCHQQIATIDLRKPYE